MATEILRPNAPGDECNISKQAGCSSCSNHYDCVDEVTADGFTTYLLEDTSCYTYYRDLYNLADHSVGNGTINKITVYACCAGWAGKINQPSLKIAIKTGGATYEGSGITVADSYANYSNEWAQNPSNAHAWTWGEIDALQAGVALKSCNTVTPSYGTYCTQVYVGVDYTPYVPQSLYQNVGQSILVIAGAMTLNKFTRGFVGEGILAIAGELGITKLFRRTVGQGNIAFSGAFDTRKLIKRIVGQGVVRIKGAFKTTLDRVLEIYSLVFAKNLEIHSLTFTKNLEIPFMDDKRALIIICEPIGG